MHRQSRLYVALLGLVACWGCGNSVEYADPEVSDPRAAEIQADPKILIERLNSKDPNARTLVIGALKRLGPKAKEAVPTLEKIQSSDPDQSVRAAAAEAIAEIQSAG